VTQKGTSPYPEIERFKKDNDLCMKCGFCISACPVYKEELVESSVARGKNAMVRALVNGQLKFTPEFARRLEKCTLCKTCTANCPAGVQIADVIVAARADQTRAKGISFPYNLIYRRLLPRRVLFGRTVRLAGSLQKLVMPRGRGKLRHLPLFLSGLGRNRQIPQVAPRFLRHMLPEDNLPQGVPVKLKAGYMTGCMTDYVFPELGKGIVEFLTRRGVEVVIPRAQGCCGAPVFLGAGDFDTGRKMADALVEAFKGLEHVVVDCATCGSAIHDYPKFLADNEERKAGYSDLARRVIHIVPFLTDVLKLSALDFKVKSEFSGKTVTWHDPCHLNRHMGVHEQPRRILTGLSDLKYVEMKDADRCCGMAGAFSLHNYELSQKIADKKVAAILESGADIVVSGCPGCEIQLMDSLARHHSDVKVLHIMELFE
jgi:glycolate oxidase iron-sulfur subunit